MAVHPDTHGADAVSRAAAAAILQVQGEVADLFAQQGRAGVVATLRRDAARLSASALAFDQIRSRALDQAADDIAWGRPPLGGWPDFLDPQSRPSTAERLAIRLQVGPPQAGDDHAAGALCRALATRLLAEEEDAFSAARRLPQRMRREEMLQEALWDDPRLTASPQTRRLMRAVGMALARKLGPSPARQAPLPAVAPPASGFWRRLLGARRP